MKNIFCHGNDFFDTFRCFFNLFLFESDISFCHIRLEHPHITFRFFHVIMPEGFVHFNAQICIDYVSRHFGVACKTVFKTMKNQFFVFSDQRFCYFFYNFIRKTGRSKIHLVIKTQRFIQNDIGCVVINKAFKKSNESILIWIFDFSAIAKKDFMKIRIQTAALIEFLHGSGFVRNHQIDFIL